MYGSVFQEMNQFQLLGLKLCKPQRQQVAGSFSFFLHCWDILVPQSSEYNAHGLALLCGFCREA